MQYSIRLAQAKDQQSILLMMQHHASFEGHQLVLTKQHQLLNNLETCEQCGGGRL